jgi:hypothetical protein
LLEQVALSLFQQRLSVMMGSNTRSRFLRYVVPVWLILVPVGLSAAEKAAPSHVCDRVALDSVTGDVGIWHDKIVRYSRARGFTGPIIWVEIVSPELSDTDNKILLMFLWWDTHPAAGATCRAGTDFARKPTVNCAESIPGTQLRLELTFEPTAHNAEKQTEKLAQYVISDVLCTLSPQPAPELGTKI